MPSSTQPSPEALLKLQQQQVIWIATTRPDGRPHLAPIWFVYLDGVIYIATDPKSVKANNLLANPRASLALEDGAHPVIAEGEARSIPQPWPADLLGAFMQKYEWDLNKEAQYNDVWAIRPRRWLAW